MNRRLIPFSVIFATLVTAAWAARTGGPYTIGADVLDGGGQTATSANYSIDGSIGGIGGVATDTVAATTLKAGFIGQLTDVTGLSVTSTPASVNEGATSQLGGLAIMDDTTVTPLASNEVVWLCASPAVTGVDANGLLAAGIVYTATLARVDGAYLGTTGSTWVLVLDSDPDNYGIYAGDGLHDGWQVSYFGTNNPNAAPEVDLFHSGQNNRFKYIAGLDPTSRTSLFSLRLAPVAGFPNRENVIFGPRYADRTYTVEFRTNLQTGVFGVLGGGSTNDAGVERTVTDLNANEPQRFYRVRISYP